MVFFKNPFKQLQMSEHMTLQVVLRMCYGVNSVKTWSFLCTVIFVICNCVKHGGGGGYLSDYSKEHKIIPFKKRRSRTKCPKHSSNICELYCKNCEVPICVQCASSSEHHGHTLVEMIKLLEKQICSTYRFTRIREFHLS